MDGDSKSHLKLLLLEFVSLVKRMAKNKHSRNSKMKVFNSYHLPLVRRVKIKDKEINQNFVIKIFENLKRKVHKANESGLNSLIKI